MTACAFLAVAAAASEPALEDWDISRYEWTGDVAESSPVTIINLHGDVRVRDGSGDEVYLLAMIQRHKDDPRRAEVATETGESGLRLEVRYPEEDAEATPPIPPIPAAWQRRRVDLTVFVPPGTHTSARTSTGLLELKGLAGDVEARSDSGDIRVRTSGALKAHTQHGKVMAQLRRTDWQGLSEIETLTGAIYVELPRGGRADVRLETRGEITTDFSIDIHRPPDSQLKVGTSKIGEGGGRLMLKSNRGGIRLIESMVPTQESPAPREEPPASKVETGTTTKDAADIQRANRLSI